jgi:hypothetical protein
VSLPRNREPLFFADSTHSRTHEHDFRVGGRGSVIVFVEVVDPASPTPGKLLGSKRDSKARVNSETMTDWLPWAPLGAVILHIFEEFVYPGGFVAWYRRYRVDASRITTRFLIIINAALLIACWDTAILVRRGAGVPYWLTIAALTCSNGCWHAWASFKSHEYSPGTITGIAIYVPLGVYGYNHFLRSGAASATTALIAAAIGCSYHIWSALFHRGPRR